MRRILAARSATSVPPGRSCSSTDTSWAGSYQTALDTALDFAGRRRQRQQPDFGRTVARVGVTLRTGTHVTVACVCVLVRGNERADSEPDPSKIRPPPATTKTHEPTTQIRLTAPPFG